MTLEENIQGATEALALARERRREAGNVLARVRSHLEKAERTWYTHNARIEELLEYLRDCYKARAE